MAGKKMGFQGLLYYGVAGTSPTTLVRSRVDATVERTLETGSTTSAGEGTYVPINTGEPTAVTEKVTFNVIVDEDDAVTAFLSNNIRAAFKFVAASGAWTFDRDCVYSIKKGHPLKGEATWDITVEQISAKDRAVTSAYT
jgi:hypothetical protein